MVRAAPHPAIAAHVRGYTGWEEWTSAPMRRRELPSGEIPLILNLGEPFTVGPADGRGAAPARAASRSTSRRSGPACCSASPCTRWPAGRSSWRT
jgi:hypothetical protein